MVYELERCGRCGLEFFVDKLEEGICFSCDMEYLWEEEAEEISTAAAKALEERQIMENAKHSVLWENEGGDNFIRTSRPFSGGCIIETGIHNLDVLLSESEFLEMTEALNKEAERNTNG